MKQSLILIIVLLLSASLYAQDSLPASEYIPYRKGKKWGLCDVGKNILVQPQYDEIDWYSDELKGFPVVLNDRHGLIDVHNKWIVKPVSISGIWMKDGKPIIRDAVDGTDYFYDVALARKGKAVPHVPQPDGGVFVAATSPLEPPYKRISFDSIDKIILHDYLQNTKIPYYKASEYTMSAVDDAIIIYKAKVTTDENGSTTIGSEKHALYLKYKKQLLLNSTDTTYMSAVWYDKGYLIAYKYKDMCGLIDDQGNEILPATYSSIWFSADQLVRYTSSYTEEITGKPGEASTIRTTEQYNTLILRTNTKVEGLYLYQKDYLHRNNKPFMIYSCGKDSSYATLYVGEDGTRYFDQ